MDQDNLFVEQAEYIDSESFLRWSSEHPDEQKIIKKLSHGGAKLLTGPRGCGKTTLMLKAYHKLIEAKNVSTLPIYVNFKSSLKLEPFYKHQPNAIFWFNQWLLFKVYQGLNKVLEDLQFDSLKILKFEKNFVDRVVGELEFGKTEILDESENQLNFDKLENDLKEILNKINGNRCVLLLDDAAHAFSPEQQRDFFEFFRKIKSRIISPKAAIYPGVTIYSSTFHVGHDAEEIDVWIKPESKNYIDFMFDLLRRRLPPLVYDKLMSDKNLITLICFSAFGLPRALLNMIHSFYEPTISIHDDSDIQFKKREGLKAINRCFDNTKSIFSSLKVKIPIYEKFISNGELIYDKMIDTVKKYNRSKDIHHQSVTIAIKQPLPPELSKVLGFFQYGGLLLPKEPISKGVKGVFEHYSIHYAALVKNNAILVKKAKNVKNMADALGIRNAHEYTRITPNKLIGTDNLNSIFPLSLPPCQNCKAPRVNEHAKFCMSCGAKLKTASIFETLVNQDIKELPLTEHRVDTIKRKSKIRTIKDILMDHENRELRGVPQVGPVWTKRIFSYAEEYIG